MSAMQCGRCGSGRAMPNLRIRDDVGLGQDLEIEVEGNPDAVLFKKAHKETLRATVCGECGNVGFSVENPKALWETYTQQKDS